MAGKPGGKALGILAVFHTLQFAATTLLIIVFYLGSLHGLLETVLQAVGSINMSRIVIAVHRPG